MKKVLVIRACAIGDFVLNLPALIALQELHPDARFTLVGSKPVLELATEFVAVDAIFSIEAQPWTRLFYEPLPGLEFDSAIAWMKDCTVAENLKRSGIHDVRHSHAFPFFGHASDHLLRSVKQPRPSLPDLWKPASRDIVVHAGSGSPHKNWPFFDSLMEKLQDAVALPQNLSLIELSQYLRRCRAFVGNDSGITHLAAYLGVPTLALFGPTNPFIWGPIGRRSRIIWKTKLEDISLNEVINSV